MDRVSIKAHAKEQIKGKIFTLLALSILVAVVSGILGFIPVVGSIAAIVIAGPLAFAMANIYWKITTKGRTPEIKDLLLGFEGDNFMRSFVGYLRMVIFTALWSLLFYIPGIIKSISYSQMFFLMAENKKMDAATAQKKSMEIMEGHKMDYFVLQLSFIPWILLGLVTFGLAFIYVEPYMETAKAEFYAQLKK